MVTVRAVGRLQDLPSRLQDQQLPLLYEGEQEVVAVPHLHDFAASSTLL